MKGSHTNFRHCALVVAAAVISFFSADRGWSAPRDPEPTIDERYQAETQAPQADLPLPSRVARPSNGPVLQSSAVVNTSAYLGVTFDPSFRNSAVVRDVHPDSPAQQAGLQPGDVIEELNGRQVRSNQDVLDIVNRMRPGSVIDISFSRRVTGRTQAALNSRPVAGAAPASISDERLPAPPFADYRVRANRPSYDESDAAISRDQRPQSADYVRRPPNNYNRNSNGVDRDSIYYNRDRDNRDNYDRDRERSRDNNQQDRGRGFLRGFRLR